MNADQDGTRVAARSCPACAQALTDEMRYCFRCGAAAQEGAQERRVHFEDILFNCERCGRESTMGRLTKCVVCHDRACNACSAVCDECREPACKKCLRACAYCDAEGCNRCLVDCQSCNAKALCADHEDVCEDCGYATCRECMKPCKKCDMDVCGVCREHHTAPMER